MAAGESRASASVAGPDDLVIPFRLEASGVRGRLVRLGPVIDTILSRHGYPDPVSEALGRALALAALLGASLEDGGKIGVQTRSDGPLAVLLADYETSGRLRGYASFDAARIAALAGRSERLREADLLGSGHLALTLDPGPGRDRSQGIVAIEKASLSEAALTYFRQSEQLPTYLRLVVARHFTAHSAGGEMRPRWRAGGLIVQSLDAEAGEADGGDTEMETGEVRGQRAEDWQRARILAASVEDHELLDPMLDPDRLLMRLFHEDGVRVFRARPADAGCSCSRAKVEAFLASFGMDQLADMREQDGGLSVTCEFCNTRYRFTPDDLP